MKPERDTLSVDDAIALVPRHPADATDVFAVVDEHRATLREWLGWVDTLRTASDMRRYAHFAQSQFENRMAYDFAIRADGRVVGGIGIHAPDYGNRSAQIGYWLAPDARGRGVITRSCATLATHAFARFDFHRLEIRCALENERSRAVPQRLGFLYEGTLAEAHVLHGAFRDIALYATTVTRWRSRV